MTTIRKSKKCGPPQLDTELALILLFMLCNQWDTVSLVRRGERRRREGDNNEDEETVIGVETGELPCGVLLARNRLSVLVAEQSSKPGGCRTSFEYKGSPTAA